MWWECNEIRRAELNVGIQRRIFERSYICCPYLTVCAINESVRCAEEIPSKNNVACALWQNEEFDCVNLFLDDDSSSATGTRLYAVGSCTSQYVRFRRCFDFTKFVADVLVHDRNSRPRVHKRRKTMVVNGNVNEVSWCVWRIDL